MSADGWVAVLIGFVILFTFQTSEDAIYNAVRKWFRKEDD